MLITKKEMENTCIKLLEFLIKKYRNKDIYTVVIEQRDLDKLITKSFYEGYIYYDAIYEETPVFELMIDFLRENITMIYTSSYDANNYYHEFTVSKQGMESTITHIQKEDLFQLDECRPTPLEW